MNRKNIIILLLVTCNFILGCSQNTNNEKEKLQIKIDNKMITKIEQKINSFSFHTYYSIDFDNTDSGCQFDILVNDIPVFKFFNQDGGINSSAPINSCILKSGKQKLKLKLYPPINRSNILVDYKENSPFYLKIMVGEPGTDGIVTNEKMIYTLPFILLPKEGLPYWEIEIEFEAEVPYEFIGWSQSKDLTKVKDIEQKVLSKYKEIQQLLNKKDYYTFSKMKTEKDIEMNISFYLQPDQIAEGEEFDRQAFLEKDAEVQALNNAKIAFYGDGKLVTLENIEDKGSALRTIIRHTENKERKEVIKFPILFHIPQNSSELEIIR